MQKKKETKKHRKQIIAKMGECIDYIKSNIHHFKSLESWQRYDFEEAANSLGFTLVETGNLADFYSIQEFCENNNLSLINHNF